MVLVGETISRLVDCSDRPRIIAIGGPLLAIPGLLPGLVRVKLPVVALVAPPERSQPLSPRSVVRCGVDGLS